MTLKRDTAQLAAQQFDLLIVGAGIYGAALCWEAAHRGLRVAVVDKADFGGATSANSLKVIHGGLRYLQHADLGRARESIGERRALLRIAPHLIQVLPTLLPTYGHGLKGREVMALGLLANDIIGFDRNRGLDKARHLPGGRTISRSACTELLPNLPTENLTGGAIYHDARAYNSERLTLSFIQSAAGAGAQVANYAAVVDLLFDDNKSRVVGAVVEDSVSGQRLSVRARTVVNLAGPWINQIDALAERPLPRRRQRFAKAFNIVLKRSLFEKYAVAITSRQQFVDEDALVKRGSRFLFVVPWRGRSMVGTEYIPYDGAPDQMRITDDELQGFLDEFNVAYPAGQLTLADVAHVQAGLFPITGVDEATGSVQLAKHYDIYDHAQDALPGLVTVMGVKYTTARDVAAKVTDFLYRQWGEKAVASKSAVTPLVGGELDDWATFVQQAQANRPAYLSAAQLEGLLFNYGTAYERVLSYVDDATAQSEGGAAALVDAETRHAVQEEMALSLTDVIFRRTEIGSAGDPGAAVIDRAASVMGELLDWNAAERASQMALVRQRFFVPQEREDYERELADTVIQ